LRAGWSFGVFTDGRFNLVPAPAPLLFFLLALEHIEEFRKVDCPIFVQIDPGKATHEPFGGFIGSNQLIPILIDATKEIVRMPLRMVPFPLWGVCLNVDSENTMSKYDEKKKSHITDTVP
tara:strand:- start:4262 stop:4621 length:360 start_codon:yes stop_codon:yes gene_type:complete